MSIGSTPDTLQIQPKHLGTLFADEEFSTTSHFVYLTGNVVATNRLSFFASTSLTFSNAELERVQMPTVSSDVTSTLPHQNFTFEEMNTYSDLDYQILRFNGGFDYRLSPNIVLTIAGEFADLTADEEWVYGDESGSLFILRSGVSIDF